MDAELVTDNLYEIPNCTICLQELSQDLANLACGHVFHISCITQHFQYRGSCPNCQKRAQTREIRLVVYPLTHNSKAGAHLRSLLANINGHSEGKQVENLLLEVKQLSQKCQKSSNDLKQSEKQNKRKESEAEALKKNLQQKTAELINSKRDNIELRKECSRLKEQEQKNFLEIIELRANLDHLNGIRKEMDQYKVLQKVASQNTEELIKFKKQMENNMTSPEEMTKAFFELLQVKTLNALKSKERQREAVEQVRFKEEQIFKLKNQIKNLKNQIEDLESQKIKWKKKYEDIRGKYKDFYEKTKSKNQQISELPELQDSLSISMGRKFGMAAKPSLPQTSFTVIEKPKIQTKLSFGSGGLKKKADDTLQREKTKTFKDFMQ